MLFSQFGGIKREDDADTLDFSPMAMPLPLGPTMQRASCSTCEPTESSTVTVTTTSSAGLPRLHFRCLDAFYSPAMMITIVTCGIRSRGNESVFSRVMTIVSAAWASPVMV